MTHMQIKGGEHPIGQIFGKTFVFRIPLYQRPYAWQQEQVEELLDDLLAYLGTGAEPVNDLAPYFLGSIVIIKEEHKPDAEVVDGQQRLTTLTILLSAIRSLLSGDDAKGLTEFIYEKGNAIEETQDRFRLTLRDRDAEFFREYVQKEGQLDKLKALNAGKLSDSQQNVRHNTVVLVERLKKLSSDTCKRLAQFIIKKCFLVVVSTPDFASAYRIFMVLNNRGLDLSHSDILKSEIIGKVPLAGERKLRSEQPLSKGRGSPQPIVGSSESSLLRTMIVELRVPPSCSEGETSWLTHPALLTEFTGCSPRRTARSSSSTTSRRWHSALRRLTGSRSSTTQSGWQNPPRSSTCR